MECVYHTMMETCPTCGHPEFCPKYGSRGRQPKTPNKDDYRESAWEDLHMVDISAGPVEPREAFDHGFDAALEGVRKGYVKLDILATSDMIADRDG